MADVVTMPKLGFDMAEGTLVRWVIAEGQEVAKGAVLAEIETDKATVEVESSFDGTLRRHLVNEGDVVPIGQAIAIVGSPDEDIENLAPSAEEVTKAGEAGPGAFTQKDIAKREQGEPAVEQESQGYVGQIKPKEGAPGAEVAQQQADLQAKQIEQKDEAPDAEGLPGGVRASPVARRMAEDMSIDIRQVRGSGPDGRVTKKDVEAFRQQPQKEPSPAQAPAPIPSAPAAPAAAPSRERPAVPLTAFEPGAPPPPDEVVPLSRLRSAIGRRMVQSKQQAPHFYVTHEYDMKPLLDLRKQVNAMLPENEKVSVNDFIIKAAALTLRQFPNINAILDGDKVIRRGQVNISIAVAVEGGLLTVVVRDADRKSVRQIAVEAKQLAERARAGKIRPEDVEGSTFSTSNLGMYDVENFIAVLNPSEAGILAIGTAREVPVVENGEIKIGTRMKATISVDHRISDGAEGARFMQSLARYIEEPLALML
jgi:pyruvate dehydrogenase E2 component (dihydrolipoamide acetyltransferase)